MNFSTTPWNQVNFYHPQQLLTGKPTAPLFGSLIICVTSDTGLAEVLGPCHLLGIFVCFKLATLPTSPSIGSPSGLGLLVCLTKPTAETIPTFGQRHAMRLKIFQFHSFHVRGIWGGAVREWGKGKRSKSKSSDGVHNTSKLQTTHSSRVICHCFFHS